MNQDTEPTIDVSTEATVLVDELVAAIVNSRIYAIEHPRVQDSIARVRRGLRELTAATGKPGVAIACAEGLIIHEQRPLLGASIGASRLITLLESWGSGGLELAADLEAEELQELFLALVKTPPPGHDYRNLNTTLEEHRCRNVRLLPPYVDGQEGAAERAARSATVRVGVRFYQSVIDLLQNVTVSVCRGGRIDFGPVHAQAEEMLKQLGAQDQSLLSLARQDQYDAFTLGHSLRVAILSMNFAKSLTDDHDLLIRIGTAALLHDVGKSLIPFEILHSPRNLDAEERRVMNRHAELGAQCLLGQEDVDPLAVAAAFGHHCAPVGKGYPRTLHPHQIAMITAIVTICDVFEALTAARPYKQPMSPIRAYRVMLAMGDKFDRRLLRRFIEQNGTYPNGQIVELSTGEIAVVSAQSDDPHRPVVTVLNSEGSDAQGPADTRLLDLSDVQCCGARRILAELTPDQATERLAPRA